MKTFYRENEHEPLRHNLRKLSGTLENVMAFGLLSVLVGNASRGKCTVTDNRTGKKAADWGDSKCQAEAMKQLKRSKLSGENAVAIPLARWLLEQDLVKGSGLTLRWVHDRGPEAPCRHERDLEPGAATPSGDPTTEALEKRA